MTWNPNPTIGDKYPETVKPGEKQWEYTEEGVWERVAMGVLNKMVRISATSLFFYKDSAGNYIEPLTIALTAKTYNIDVDSTVWKVDGATIGTGTSVEIDNDNDDYPDSVEVTVTDTDANTYTDEVYIGIIEAETFTSVETAHSVLGDGTTANAVKLDGDEASPGNSKYYGTDGLGNRGYHGLPDGMDYPGAGIALSTGTGWGDSITDNSSNWDTAFGWGDHSQAGYLTSETDPTVPQHVKDILQTDIDNWDTAFGWGDHSLAGYLQDITAESILDLSDTPIAFDSGKFLKSGASAVSFQSITEADITDLGDYLTEVGFNDLTGSPSDVITAGDNLSWDGDILNAVNTMRDPATESPLAHGTAAVGISLLYARQDHVHPSDNTDNYVNSISGGGNGTLTLGRTGSLSDLTTNLSHDHGAGEYTDTNYYLTGLSLTGTTLTATMEGTANQTVDLSPLEGTDTNYYLDSLSFNTDTGILTASVNGAIDQTVNLDGRYLESAPVTSVFGRDGVVIAEADDYTWAQIDKENSNLADITTKSHTDLDDIGTNSHNQIDTHISSDSIHREIDNNSISPTSLWSGSKISSELGGKSDTGHTHLEADITDLGDYLTEETDPVFSASPAADITSVNIGYWNEAHGWGNHSQVGYLTEVSWNIVTDKPSLYQGFYLINHGDTPDSDDFIASEGVIELQETVGPAGTVWNPDYNNTLFKIGRKSGSTPGITAQWYRRNDWPLLIGFAEGEYTEELNIPIYRDPEVISLGDGLEMSDSTLNCTVTEGIELNLSGVYSKNINIAPLEDSLITVDVLFAQLILIGLEETEPSRLLGRGDNGVGPPEVILLGGGLYMDGSTLEVDLSAATTFTYGTAGIVPGPDDTTHNDRFLRADGSWVVPEGTGGGTSDPMATLSTGNGISGQNYDGTEAREWSVDFGSDYNEVARGNHKHVVGDIQNVTVNTLIGRPIGSGDGPATEVSIGNGLVLDSTSLKCTISDDQMDYPGAGIARSSGSSWNTSLTIGDGLTIEDNTLKCTVEGGGGYDGLEIDNKGTSTSLEFSTDDNKYYKISATGTRNIYINNTAGNRARTLMIELSSSTTANRDINWHYGTSGNPLTLPTSSWQDGTVLSYLHGDYRYIMTITNSGTGSSNLRISYIRIPK